MDSRPNQGDELASGCEQLAQERAKCAALDSNILTFIGLMKRAGALAIGAEGGYDAARAGKARLLCLASDAAKNTVDGAHNAVNEGRVPLMTLPYSKQTLGAALGQRECAALAVTDTGFALSLCQKLGLEQETQLLSARLEREKRRKGKKRKAAFAKPQKVASQLKFRARGIANDD